MEGNMVNKFFVPIFLIIIFILSGCVNSAGLGEEKEAEQPISEEKTILYFLNWAISEEISSKPLLSIEQKYKDRNNNIDIKNLPTSWEGTKNTLLTSMISNNAPDIAHIASPWFGQLLATNELEPLNEYLDEKILGMYDRKILSEYTVDGNLYALPWVEISLNVFWNLNVLEKANININDLPGTYEEFLDTIIKIGDMPIKGDKIYGFGLPSAKDEITVNILNSFLKSTGVDFLDEDGKVIENKEALVKILDAYCILGKGSTIPKNMSIKDQYSLFAEDKIAGFIDGLYARHYLRLTSKKGKDYDKNIIVTALPSYNGKVSPVNNDQLLVMFKSSNNKMEAAKFISYLCTDKDATDEYYLGSGFAPASPMLLRDSLYINDEIARVFIENMPSKFNYALGKTPYYSEAIEHIGTGINLVTNGKMTANEGADYIIKNLKNIYEE